MYTIYFGLPIIFLVSYLLCEKPYYFYYNSSVIHLKISLRNFTLVGFFQKLSWPLLLFMVGILLYEKLDSKYVRPRGHAVSVLTTSLCHCHRKEVIHST